MRFLTLLALSSLIAASAAADRGWHWGDSDRGSRWDSYREKVAEQSHTRGKSATRSRFARLDLSRLNSGVCDPLADATRGLKYLCIAFCELQDCQPDYSLENPFQNCSRSSKWLFARYEARRGAGDPDMPCVKAPDTAAECPCWARNELASLRGNGAPDEISACFQNVSGTGLVNYDAWQISNAPGQTMKYLTTISSIENSESDGSAVCSLVDTCDDGNCMGANRFMGITAEQFAACEQDVYQSALDRGLTCMDLGQ
jgi:hypothetical protein